MVLGATCGLATLALGGSVHASPQDLFGFGARSSAMGASGPASAEGYEAVYGAPGLLAETRQKTFTLGIAIARHLLHADTPSESRTLPTDEMKTIYIGAALPLPFGGVLKDRVTLGFGFLDPAKFLVRGKILYPERYQYPIIAPRVQSLAIILGLGIRLGDRWYVGAGYEALAAVVGQITIAQDSTGRTGARSDDQVVAAYAPIASLACDVTDHLRIGLTYRGELIGRFEIKIRAQDLGINLPDFNVAGVAQYDPQQLAAEVRWSSVPNGTALPLASDGWRVTLGAVARRWSRYPGQVEQTVAENKDFSPPPTEAKDTISPRIGFEKAFALTSLAGLRLRAGYMYEPTPLPKQTKAVPIDSKRSSTTNLLDSDRHVLTAGVGIVLGDDLPLQLDTFAQLHILAPREHVKDPDVSPDALGYPSVKSSGTIWVVGMTIGVRF
jgi:long-subunit fatty acid transport protein